MIATFYYQKGQGKYTLVITGVNSTRTDKHVLILETTAGCRHLSFANESDAHSAASIIDRSEGDADVTGPKLVRMLNMEPNRNVGAYNSVLERLKNQE